jgi:peptide/nickel transport system substrate-binding protein
VKRKALLGLLALVLSACGAPPEAPRATTAASPEPSAEEAGPARGGTLRVGLVRWAGDEELGFVRLDPFRDYNFTSFELFRCCLVRTLMSYNGQPTGKGGGEARPDLADGQPVVSSDGLTWTFRLKQGLHYAPPHEDREIVAGDLVRALETSARLEGGNFQIVPLIEGAEAYANGEADTITGIEAPDDYTFVVHLISPTGDLGERFALPSTTPLPPDVSQSDVASGSFAATGPYMIERYAPGESIVLVRNPSWTEGQDDLRPAHADRIELTIGLTLEEAYAQVETGALDLVLDESPPPHIRDRYRDDPELRRRLSVYPADTLFYVAMNVAAPPFDDANVRRAVSLVVDKKRLVEAWGGPLAAVPARHIAPDSLEANLLLDYDPYASPNDRGDVKAARAVMAMSRYDSNGDGVCDDPACEQVPAIALDIDPYVAVASPVSEDLEQIGVMLELEKLPSEEFYGRLGERAERVALVANFGWSKDFPNGSAWFAPLFDPASPGHVNPFLVGLSAGELEGLGYQAAAAPSIDAEIEECNTIVGGAQTQCWARLDQLLMEEIVPAVPLLQPAETRIVSERVVSISIDQLTNQPALDRIALDPEQR